jgi:hypothetical protein
MFENIPWLAVIVATVANMILGFLWYGPLFGKQWGEASDIDMENTDGGSPAMYAAPALGGLVAAIAIYNIMVNMTSIDVMGGLTAAFSAWLAFTAFTSYTNATFRGTSTRLWSIETTAHLAGFALSGIILAFMA